MPFDFETLGRSPKELARGGGLFSNMIDLSPVLVVNDPSPVVAQANSDFILDAMQTSLGMDGGARLLYPPGKVYTMDPASHRSDLLSFPAGRITTNGVTTWYEVLIWHQGSGEFSTELIILPHGDGHAPHAANGHRKNVFEVHELVGDTDFYNNKFYRHLWITDMTVNANRDNILQPTGGVINDVAHNGFVAIGAQHCRFERATFKNGWYQGLAPALFCSDIVYDITTENNGDFVIGDYGGIFFAGTTFRIRGHSRSIGDSVALNCWDHIWHCDLRVIGENNNKGVVIFDQSALSAGSWGLTIDASIMNSVLQGVSIGGGGVVRDSRIHADVDGSTSADGVFIGLAVRENAHLVFNVRRCAGAGVRLKGSFNKVIAKVTECGLASPGNFHAVEIEDGDWNTVDLTSVDLTATPHKGLAFLATASNNAVTGLHAGGQLLTDGSDQPSGNRHTINGEEYPARQYPEALGAQTIGPFTLAKVTQSERGRILILGGADSESEAPAATLGDARGLWVAPRAGSIVRIVARTSNPIGGANGIIVRPFISGNSAVIGAIVGGGVGGPMLDYMEQAAFIDHFDVGAVIDVRAFTDSTLVGAGVDLVVAIDVVYDTYPAPQSPPVATLVMTPDPAALTLPNAVQRVTLWPHKIVLSAPGSITFPNPIDIVAGFGITVAANVVASPLGRNTNPTFASQWIPTRSGSVRKLACSFDQVLTAGAVALRIRINGVINPTILMTMGLGSAGDIISIPAGVVPFNAREQVEIIVDTMNTMTPTPISISASLEVEYT